MTDIGKAPGRFEAFWQRWWRKTGEFEAVLDLTYDDLQDRRMDRIERELASIQSELSLRPASDGKSSKP